jgi:putative inorganic carbon (HCO3(-)) transporter
VSWLGALGIAIAATIVGLAFGILGAELGPWVIVAVPAGALLLASCLARPVVGVVLVFVSLPIALEELPVAGLQVIDVAMVLAVGAVTVAVLVRRGSPDLRIPALGWGLALCGAAVLAIPGAIDPGRATTRVITLLAGLALAAAIVAACEQLADVRLLVGVLLGVGVVMTLLAFQDVAGLRAEAGGLVVRDRASGVFGDPNELGSFAVILLLVSLGMLIARVGPALRVLAGTAALLSVGALILSLSRGSWIGAGVGLIVLMVLVPGARRALLGALCVGVVVGVGIGAFRATAPEVQVVRERFGALTSSFDSPYDDRPQIWAEAQREITERPWFGWGPANFGLASARSGSESRRVGAEHAHNVVLTVGAEAGLLAVAFLIGLTISTAVVSWRSVHVLRSRPEGIVLAGVGAALAGEVAHGLIDYTLGNPMLLAMVWALTGIVLAGGQLSRASGLVTRPLPDGRVESVR